MAFPSNEEIIRGLKKLEKLGATIIPSKNASPLVLFRFQLSQNIVKYKMSHKLTTKELSKIFKVDQSYTEKLLRNRLKGISTDRLINLYLKIQPEAKFKIFDY